MAKGQKQTPTGRRATSDCLGRRSPRRRASWGLLGVALLLMAMIAASVAACGSDTGAASGTTTTSAVADATGQTGPRGQFPGGAGGPMMQGGLLATTDVTTSTTLAQTTTSTPAPTTTTTLAEGSYSDGIYLVGTDISSGLYKGTVDDGAGHWEISTDANGERFVASGDPAGQFYVKATSGYYLRLTGVTIAKASTTAADPLPSSNIGDGTYRVGYDIAAGWYQGAVDDSMGYWEVTSDANAQSLVANDYPLAPFTVKVKSGQYITLRGVSIGQ